jgi:tetratricopeptide (TPR) repeat protein
VSGDDADAAYALIRLGWVAAAHGDHRRAEDLYRESLELYRAAGHLEGEAGVLLSLGALEFLQGNFKEAVHRYEENLARLRAAGNRANLPIALANLADAVHRAGDRERALALYKEAMPIYTELGDQYGIAQVQFGLGSIALDSNDPACAFQLLLESLTILQEIGEQTFAIECLELLAHAAHAVGAVTESAVLFGTVAALRERAGVPIQPVYRDQHERFAAAVQESLGVAEFTAGLARGRAMSLADAVSLVRSIEQRTAVAYAENVP